MFCTGNPHLKILKILHVDFSCLLFLTFVAYEGPSVGKKLYLFIKRKLVLKRRDGKPF